MTNPADRRRSPRVQLVGQLHGELVPIEAPVSLREISLGGLSFDCARLFAVGRRVQFLLTLGDGATVLVHGQIVYSRAAPAPREAEFITGVQFLDDDAPDASATVGGLIQKLK